MYRCTVIRQPFADAFIKAVRTDAEGMTFAEKSIDIHSYPTEYRGDVLICSSSKGVGDANRNGVTIGVVELYDVRSVETFTDKEWAQTRVSRENWRKEKKWFGWFYRNPRPRYGGWQHRPTALLSTPEQSNLMMQRGGKLWITTKVNYYE